VHPGARATVRVKRQRLELGEGVRV